MKALCWQRILRHVPRSEAVLLGEGLASLSLLSIEDEVAWGLQRGLRGAHRRRRGRIRGRRQCDKPAGVQGDGCLRPSADGCAAPCWIKEWVQNRQTHVLM